MSQEDKDKEIEEAIVAYSKAIELSSNPQNYKLRGHAYYKKGEYDKAIDDYTKAMIFLADGGDYFDRAEAYYKKGEYDKAIDDYTEAIRRMRRDGTFDFYYRSRGQVYFQKGEYDKAIDDYSELIKNSPRDSWYYKERGDSYYKKGEIDKAIADYDKSIELLENFKVADFYNSRGEAYFSKGMFDKAIIDFNEAVKLDPDNTQFNENLNKALDNKNAKDKAIEEKDKLDNLAYFPNVKPANATAPRLQPVPKTPHIPPEQQAPYEDNPELAEFKQAQKKLEASIQKTMDIKKLYNCWAAGTGIDPTVFGEQLKLILDIPKDATVGFSRKKNAVGTKYVEIRWEREIKVNNDTKTESYEFSIGKLNANEELELHEDIAKALSAGKNWAESLKERRNKPARIK